MARNTIEILIKSIFEGKGARDAERSLDRLETKTDRGGTAAQTASGKYKRLDISAAAAASGLLAVGAAAVMVGGRLVNAASDAEEMQSKFDVVFANTGGRVTDALEDFGAAVGRSRLELMGMASTLGDTLKPMGFTEDAAANLAVDLTQLATDLSSFNNMPMDEALRRLQGTLVGSHENALAFGVIINENTLKAEMAAHGWDKLKGAQFEQAKVQARINLLIKGTTDAQGDAARTADGYANKSRALQAKLSDLSVELGTQLLPAVTEFVNLAADFVEVTGPALSFVIGSIGDSMHAASADMRTGAEALGLLRQSVAPDSGMTLAERFLNIADATGELNSALGGMGSGSDGIMNVVNGVEALNQKANEFLGLDYQETGFVTALNEAHTVQEEILSISPEVLRHYTSQADVARDAAAAIDTHRQSLIDARGPNEELNDKIAQRNNLLGEEEIISAGMKRNQESLTATREAHTAALEAEKIAYDAAVEIAQSFADAVRAAEPVLEAAIEDTGALSENYRQLAVDKALAKAETIEEVAAALDLAVAMGTLTEVQAEARLEYARDIEAIEILTTRLQDQTISADEAAEAVRILGETEGVGAERALAMAGNQDIVNASIKQSATDAEIAAGKLGELTGDAWIVEYQDNSHQAIANADAVKSRADGASGTRNIHYNITSSGLPSFPGSGGQTIYAYHDGGRVAAQQPILVGDGPGGRITPNTELFVPQSSGMVVANNQLMTAVNALGGGQQGVTINDNRTIINQNERAAMIQAEMDRQRWQRQLAGFTR